MMDDKQRQVKTARDALMDVSTPDQGADSTSDIAVLVNALASARQAQEEAEQQERIDGLVREAIEALVAWHVTSGVDKGDRLRNAAQKLWEARQ